MNKKEKKIIISLILILVLIDQISKIFIVIKTNQHVGFVLKNIFTSTNISYILVDIIAISALIRYISKNNQFIKTPTRVIISFAIAAAISNMIDRLWNAGVIAINLKNSLSINLSYIYVCIAWIGMAVLLTIYTSKKIKKKREKKEEK